MKTQITTIAAAIALAASFTVSANQPYTDADLNPNAQNANDTANPFFDDLEDQRRDMDGFTLGSAGIRTSIIDQDGHGNFAEASQKGQAQYSLIEQDGDSNQARVRQNNNENESLVYQTGNSNQARVVQLSADRNDSYVYQYGDLNNASVTQIRSEFSDSMVEQLGDRNRATVRQTDNADYTWSFVSQHGDDNVATVDQFDSRLSASYIYQSGYDGHLAEVSQTGIAQASTIRQNGSSAHATHTQAGGNNVAVTTQW